MKKEIMSLINSNECQFRLNNVSYLKRWTLDILGNEVDRLKLEFDTINDVRFSIYDTEIKSRDYDEIIEECKILTERFLQEVSDSLVRNLESGYINTNRKI